MKADIHLKREDLVAHELLLGKTKFGKTCAMLHQYESMLSIRNLFTMLFAVEGSELRILESLKRKNVMILDAHRFRYNPLAPINGATIEEAVDDVLRSLSSLWLGIASMGALKPILLDIMRNKGTIADLGRRVFSMKHGELRDKIMNRLVLLDARFFSGTEPLDLDLIAGMHVIFLIESLDSQAAAFFLHDLTAKLMRFKRNRREHFRNPADQNINILLLDEAQRFLPSASLQRDDLAFLPLMSAIAQSRKLGIGFVMALQQPSFIHPAFMAQAGVILAGSLASEMDIRGVRMALGLTNEQVDFYRNMPQRTFLMRKDGPAFPVTIPEVQLSNKPFSAEDIDAWNREVIANSDLPLASLFQREDGKAPSVPLAVQKDAFWLFLDCVNRNQCRPVTWYYAHPTLKEHFALQKANRIRRELQEQGLVKIHKVKTGLRYVLGIEITEKGYQRSGLKPTLIASRGGEFPHTYIVENVKRTLEEKGAVVQREKKLGDHWADLVTPDMAIEVAIGNKPELEAQGILENLRHVKAALVVGNDKAHIEEVRKALPKEALDLVQFKLFYEVGNA